MPRVSFAAVFLGMATDLVLTNLLLIPVAAGVFASPDVQALPVAEQSAAWQSIITSTQSPVFTMGTLLGSLASVCGGWVAAAVAKRSELTHGFLSALACVALGVYGWVAGTYEASVGTHLGYMALSPALGMLGGALRRRGVRRRLERGDATEPRSRVAWLILSVDWLIAGMAMFVTILFATAGMTTKSGAPPYEPTTVAVVVVFGTLLFGVYVIAAHALRVRHRYRWVAHAVAIVVTVLPVLLAQ